MFNKEKEWWQFGVAVTGKQEKYIKKISEILKIKTEIKDINQKILDAYKIRRPVKYVIIDVEDINEINGNISYKISKNQYKPISKFPPTIRDLAFIIDTSVSSDEVKKSILGVSNAIFLVEVFDEFESDKFGEGKKSLAFHIWMQNIKNPMSEEEIKKLTNLIIKKVENTYNAKLRS